MRKFAYLLAMMQLCLNMTAQVELNDGVWKAYPHNSVTRGIEKELQI